ncbi:unnamed protein product [Cunninghamella blakesleeana]
MTKVFCYITFKVEEQEKEQFKNNCLFNIEFIDKHQVSTSSIIKELQENNTNPLALIWESEKTILLIKKNEQPKKYEIENEFTLLTKDISTLSVPSSTYSITTTRRRSSNYIDNKNKIYHMLYLTVHSPKGEINQLHRYLIEQSVLKCIQQQKDYNHHNNSHKEYGLFIILNLPNISQDYFQSIQTQQQWEQWQSCITQIYLTQVSIAYQHHHPLFDMNVVLPMICGYDVALQHGIDTIFVLPQDTNLIQQWNQRRQDLNLSHLLISPLEVPFDLLELSLKVEDKEVQEEKIKEDQLEIFNKVAVGGTFDQLHAGHKILLTMTALSTRKSLIVGVTDDVMLVSKKNREFIASTDVRISKVSEFLHRVRNGLDYSIVPITDPFGPTITDPSIQALICSHETLKGSQMVNDERLKRNFNPLAIKIIDVISSSTNKNEYNSGNDTNWSDKISSSWIRQYLVDHQQK